ncbi:MAG: ATP-binding protein [Bacteroidetes bacterium]|jgi:uncharacterized protein|nr:ATP-binding protein [Bacteroidota bacterium]MBT6685316.1 ATP-binding protein [Bacteroidota bacterium]MBT7142874.1 ATP-binding protein [Bacteroidota bacterium]MBT7490355.1 ATP-binding protein [Bacteroidota bacterium]
MERKIEKNLLEWKDSPNSLPLIIHGARQVGKTYSILEFGKKYFKNVLYFNFESNSELTKIFDKDLKPERILNELSVFSGKSILEHESLIFFDEIQASEKTLTSLKYFAEQSSQFHIIAAGSLLGVAINHENYSFPVGKVEMQTLYPMDFEEFLWAIQEKNAVEIIRESYRNNSECSLHQHFIDLYKIYLCTGGLPQVVKEYMDKGDFDFVSIIQKNINDAYIADMTKYVSPTETIRIMAAYNSIPAQLAKINKKFQYKIIKSGARANQYELSLHWLNASGIVVKCLKTTAGKFPLSLHAENNSFKIYMNDSGLLLSKFGVSANAIMSGNEGFNNIKGILAENYVANSLVINGYVPHYWESKGKAELDFVIQTKNGEVIPIEVKSSENVRSKSLQQFVLQYKPLFSIRISLRNFGFENNIKSIPLYACFCI